MGLSTVIIFVSVFIVAGLLELWWTHKKVKLSRKELEENPIEKQPLISMDLTDEQNIEIAKGYLAYWKLQKLKARKNADFKAHSKAVGEIKFWEDVIKRYTK